MRMASSIEAVGESIANRSRASQTSAASSRALASAMAGSAAVTTVLTLVWGESVHAQPIRMEDVSTPGKAS